MSTSVVPDSFRFKPFIHAVMHAGDSNSLRIRVRTALRRGQPIGATTHMCARSSRRPRHGGLAGRGAGAWLALAAAPPCSPPGCARQRKTQSGRAAVSLPRIAPKVASGLAVHHFVPGSAPPLPRENTPFRHLFGPYQHLSKLDILSDLVNVYHL